MTATCAACGGVALQARGAEAFGVDPVEAIEFLRQKVNVPTRAWTDLWEGQHSRAFMVAGAQSDGLLADFHEAVNRNIAEGRTLTQFRQDFDRIVEGHGWNYHGSRNWRSAVIFNTNLRTAYSAGRWEQIQRVKGTRPYLRYVAVNDARTRPQHAEWHDTVLPVDDPWWNTHFPPNGWNCRCTVMSLNERDLKRYGFKVSDSAPPVNMVDRSINTPEGPVTIQVPDGIDPGFGYNPGRASVGSGPDTLAIERHGRFRPLNAPGPAPQRLPLPLDAADAPLSRGGDIRAALRSALGGEEAFVTDPTGAVVHLTQSIADHMLDDPRRQDGRERYFPLLPGMVRDPAEIWIGWAAHESSGRVTLRRRYVKLVDLGEGRVIGLVTDADGGEWAGLTMFRGRTGEATGLRSGLLVYRRG